MPDIPLQTPLDAKALRWLGIPAPWSFGLADRVRFGELDILAHVNNTAYLRWVENFRIRYFEDYGIADYSGEVPRIVLRQIGMDFLSEMRLGQTYVVTGRTTALRTTSFRMDYAVWASGTLRATGWAILVMLDQTGAKEPISQAARAKIIERDAPELL